MEGDDDDDDESLDSNGIPGWDKVDRLAKALVDLSGLSITNNQARNIKVLYDELLEFDKRPLVFAPRPLKPPQGRFARSKSSSYRVGSVTTDHVKRAFLSAGIPSCSPAKSRLVEAICLNLCDRYPREKREVRGDGKSVNISRWNLILSHYFKIRARLCNSHKLLTDTNVVLFNINQATLTRWYKNSTRRDEIKMLMQGCTPPPNIISQCPLPPPRELPLGPLPAPLQCHIFDEPEDTTGQAKVRGITPPAIVSTPSTSTKQSASRTTEWRQRKKAAASISTSQASTSTSVTSRKVYTCRICGNPMTSPGHTQYRGQRYCPEEPEQIPKEEWLALKKIEAKAKAALLPPP